MNISPFDIRIPKREWISSPDAFSKNARQQFNDFLDNSFYLKHGNGFLILRITQPKQSLIGIIAMIDLDDYRDGKVMKHEETLVQQQQVSLELLIRRKAMIKPTLLFHPPVPLLSKLIQKWVDQESPRATFNFSNMDEVHEYWLVPEAHADASHMKDIFSTISKTYIADGHHRFAAAEWLSKHEAFPNQILSAFFAFDQIRILDFNRIVDMPAQHTHTSLLVFLSKYFNIKPLRVGRKPKRKHELSMKIGMEWYRIRWRTKWLNRWREEDRILFDSDLLGKHILQGGFDIGDVRSDNRIKYHSGKSGVHSLEAKMKENQVAFMLYPVQIEELVSELDHGHLLPPKSTWFEPRMRNGIVVSPWSPTDSQGN